MLPRLLVLALSILTVNLACAQATFDKTPFKQRLLGKVLLNAPMTAQEIDAMEPACLQIGMGKAGKNGGWQFDDMSHEDFVATLHKPEFAMTLLPSGGYAQWFHHYCTGMLGKYRFLTGTKTPHDNLKTWRSEMEYCLRDSKGKAWIYENRTRKELAEALFHSKNYMGAIAAAKEVLAADVSYADAYTIMADSYAALKQNDKALSAVTEGLRYAPDSRGMKRRYKDLGGKLPFPEPIAKAAVAESAPVKPSSEQPGVGQKQENLSSDATGKAPQKPVQDGPASAATVQPASPAPTPRLQEPENSKVKAAPADPAGKQYCRFCP